MILDVLAEVAGDDGGDFFVTFHQLLDGLFKRGDLLFEGLRGIEFTDHGMRVHFTSLSLWRKFDADAGRQHQNCVACAQDERRARVVDWAAGQARPDTVASVSKIARLLERLKRAQRLRQRVARCL